MSVGDLVIDRLGRCGIVVKESEEYWVSYLVLFSGRGVWCSKYEFRVLDS